MAIGRKSAVRVTIVAVVLVAVAGTLDVAADDQASTPLTDKTLVVWVSPANLAQKGGSTLTVNDTTMDRFDGIIFGELEPGVWMPGSNGYSRTCQDQANWPKETVADGSLVQVAIVYEGPHITLYRDGKQYAEYTTEGASYTFGRHTAVLFGQRHLNPGVDCFQGRIRDARVYAQPLDQPTIAALRPGEAASDLVPWAWWDFATTGTYDRAGRFNQVKLTGGARLQDGCLVLEGSRPLMLATRSDDGSGAAEIPTNWSRDEAVPAAVVQSSRLLREKFLSDPYRPRYHFCVPEDNGMPGDPNGCFYAGGRYHLMYLYNRSGAGFSWGHVSSHDLVHWRHHPDAIGPGDGDEGCFSGGAFVDGDSTAYLSYWMLWGDKGIGLARSTDGNYDQWQKLAANPVIKSSEWGITETVDPDGQTLIYGSADPSNIWKKDGKYYLLTGNLLVLNKYGRQSDAPPSMRGDRLYLFASEDLTTWQYQGVFYERRDAWTDASEDNMCPSFLPLPANCDGGLPSGKHLLLFISHNKGCQYYVGDYDTQHDRFRPGCHGRMTWVDNTYFAPEALVDGQGRQIMWAWLTDNPANEEVKGWSGVYGLPRSLWLGPDGTLRMAPVKELQMLRGQERSWPSFILADKSERVLEGVTGDSCELEIRFTPGTAQRYGVRVRASSDRAEETLLYYDATHKELCFDATRSGHDGRQVLEQAPLALAENEPLVLRIFIDKSVVEVYANDRQAIGRRVYPVRSDSLGVMLFAEEGEARVESVTSWEMAPSNPY